MVKDCFKPPLDLDCHKLPVHIMILEGLAFDKVALNRAGVESPVKRTRVESRRIMSFPAGKAKLSKHLKDQAHDTKPPK